MASDCTVLQICTQFSVKSHQKQSNQFGSKSIVCFTKGLRAKYHIYSLIILELFSALFDTLQCHKKHNNYEFSYKRSFLQRVLEY